MDTNQTTDTQLPRALLEVALEHAADEVFLMRADGSVRYVNKATLQRRGFTMDQMLGLSVWEWNEFVTAESWKRRWKSLLEIKKARFESVHIDSAGNRFPVDIQARLIEFQDTYYCLCFVNSLSEQYQTINYLEHRNERLIEMNARADMAVTTLEAAARNKELLFGTIAHELRTPIASIAMMANESDTADWRDAQSGIQRLSRDLLHTLDDMRRLTREGHQRAVETETFTLAELAHALELAVSAYTSQNGVALSLNFADPKLPPTTQLRTDLYRLRVVLANLIKNACIHSESDEVEVSFTTQANQLSIRVIDRGVGIPHKHREAIFEPYARGDTSVDGSGLGLHIARSWIAEIGGSLHLVDRPLGTCFEVELPLTTLVSESTELEDSGTAATEEAMDFSQLRILFVEDDPTLRLISETMLGRITSNLVICEDGAAALEALAFAKEGFDLVITDYFMPNMNGFELCLQLRSSGFTGPIYGCTAATLGDEIAQLEIAGANHVFAKPLTRKALLSRLEHDAHLLLSGSSKAQYILDADGELSMQADPTKVLEQHSDQALLLINLETKEVFATEKWLELNDFSAEQKLDLPMVNSTIDPSCFEAYRSYAKLFFAMPDDAAPIELSIHTISAAGRRFNGTIRSHKLRIGDSLFAVSEFY